MANTIPEPSRPKMYGRPTLRERGWTDALIERFLPVPDLLAPNRYYHSAPPRKLYLPERVEAIEASDAFRIAGRKAGRRKTAAKKAVATKRQRIERYVETVEIDVPILAESELIESACRHYNWRRSYREDEDFRPASPDSDPRFLGRIAVNYLRHRLTSYEAHLDRIRGKVGTGEAYPRIKLKVLEAIAAAYPTLADECERQKAVIETPNALAC